MCLLKGDIMRKPSKLELTDQQRSTLMTWIAAGKTEQRFAKRAQVILCSAEAMSLKDIEAKSGLSLQSILKWRKRFAQHGIKGLEDIPRKGRPQIITPEERVQVMALACTKPDDGSNQWTTTKLADASGLARTTVHRILNEASLKPQKIDQWCGKSPDPEFEPKQTGILGLYLSSPENALVISVDEKSQIQALDRTQPMLPLKPNHARRQTHIYTRHDATCLLAALLVHQGTVEGRRVDSHTHVKFLGFLKHLYRKYPHKELHVIVDNYNAHKHQKVMEWASKRRRLTLHFTPTYTSWLNQIEIWFSIYTREVIRGGVWQSKQELVSQTMQHIKRYNETNAAPFNWTYTGKPLVA